MSLFTRGYNSRPNNSGYFISNNKSSEQVEVPVPDKISLDSEQDTIVHSDARNILVVAGAGSGKTRVLTERISYLVREKNVNPVSIVAITFTNMASEEMKLRLSDIPNIGDAFIGTIHSFANHIMKESGEKYSLFTDDVDIQLHKELIGKYCRYLTQERYLEYRDLITLVDTGKRSEACLKGFFSPSEMFEFSMLHLSVNNVEFYKKYNPQCTFGESIYTLCKLLNIITFDELIVKAKAYFEKINATVDYCFVDEFQDVGMLEYNFIRSLNANHYFFVGDDWQAIYSFKGGNVEIFKSLTKKEDFTTYYLTNNYRNGSDIIDLANTVITQCNSIIQKDIHAISPITGSVSVMTKRSIKDVLFTVKSGKSFKNWFVLCRTNKEIFELQKLLAEVGIPYVTFKREGMSLAEMNKLMYSDRVKLLTVHVSKGLETDNVILYGNFPVFVPYYRMNEEERRVMYVGCTRARNKLYILN